MTQNARHLIQTRGRPTPARVRVLDMLLKSSSALSHAELEERLSQDGALDRVTLYRVLDWLVEQGLAHKIEGYDRVWRYNATGREEYGHAHFHCTRCSKVYCLNELRPSYALTLPSGYRLQRAELTLHGLCPSCSSM